MSFTQEGSRDFVAKTNYVPFCLPYPLSEIPVVDWADMARTYLTDLQWLLSLPPEMFWRQISQEESLHASLTSFLQEAPRPHTEEFSMIRNSESSSLFFEIYRDVFLLYARMATYKESDDYFRTADVYGELIYDKFVFDIAKMMDLCALYGSCNTLLLSKMIANIFHVQPKYNEDLEQAAASMSQIFGRILERLGLEADGLEAAAAVAQDQGDSVTPEDLKDTIDYLLDISVTLSSFLDVYPPASDVFVNHELPKRIMRFYEAAVPFLGNCLSKTTLEDKERFSRILMFIRKQLIGICHSLVYWTAIQPLLNNYEPHLGELCGEKWLHLVSMFVPEKHFLVDYDRLFPLEEDVELIAQSGVSVDPLRLEYIRDALRTYLDEFGLTSSAAVKSGASGATRANGRAEDHDPGIDQVADVAITSLVTQVKDLLPDLEETLIKRCLEHYDYNAESVINAVLEGNLPPHLTEEKREPPPAILMNDTQKEDKAIGKQRRTKTVRFEELKDSLNTKEVPKSLILENVARMTQEYDDEYDDTYDSHAVGAAEPDASELEAGRAFVTPRVLRGKEEVEDEEEGEDDEEVEGGNREPPRDHFVQNPAELRERAEQRWQNRRGMNRGPPPPRDVVGGPRGQGQEKDVLIARRHKTENKNRGRRHMADRKRREF